MSLESFLSNLKTNPSTVEFEDSIEVIERNYTFSPTAFNNGETQNEANQNNGSCKILAFGQLNSLSVEETLHCFGRYYRVDVLQHPEKDDHQNIRQFIKCGWKGLSFKQFPLDKSN